MKKLLILTVLTYGLQALACTPASTTGRALTPEEARTICSRSSMFARSSVSIAVSVEQLRVELNYLMNQHNDRVQGMNQLIMYDLPQRQSIEQLLFQRLQLISRMVYLQNVLSGPLYPNQRHHAMMELEQLRMGLSNGDAVLNQFISNYNYMYNQFWKLNREAADLQNQIQAKQTSIHQVIEKEKQAKPTPERLAALEAEKQKLEKGKAKLLALAKEAETAAARAKELQLESGSLVDELSETLNMDF
jgi:hypothetical protein